jgi:PilZ domain
MDRREHYRVQLRLPARLRWTTPFGQKTEVCVTVNVSRGGLLVPCQEAHSEGMSLWVTFPYDASILYGQPEILAKVVRWVAAQNGRGATPNGNGSSGHGKGSNGNGSGGKHVGATFSTPTATRAAELDAIGDSSSTVAVAATNTANEDGLRTLVALRFNLAPRRHPNGNGSGQKREIERRFSERQPFAVPVRVRPEHVPWFEEAMTVDCSMEGLKFRSNREYDPGQFLVVSFENADTSPWPVAAESILVVVRIERELQSPALNVAVRRSQQFSFRF